MFLTQLVEVTPTRILALLMVEMSSTLDRTNRGPRKTEFFLATAAYLRPLLEEKNPPPPTKNQPTNNPVNWMKLCNWIQSKASCRGIFTSALANLVPMGSLTGRVYMNLLIAAFLGVWSETPGGKTQNRGCPVHFVKIRQADPFEGIIYRAMS